MPPSTATGLRYLAGALSILLLLAAGFCGWFYFRLEASLPRLDGTVRISGLSAAVSIERDALGVPTIRGSNRTDVVRALGFLHAQDRFFQMDLQRRRAAGQLSELFGKTTLAMDRANRRHGFRALARKVVAGATSEQRALIQAYSAGVNAGLASLGAKPFEYYVLRARPQPWRPEDCALVLYSMALTLQDVSGRYEHTLATLRDTYGAGSVSFFAPLAVPSDAALDGTTAALAPIPPPEAIDLRKNKNEAFIGLPPGPRVGPPFASEDGRDRRRCDLFASDAEVENAPGSNSFAISGRCTSNGAALLENDMHLDLSVPNVWYRASLRVGNSLNLTAVTLPGLPLMIAGSNGHIAWGLTSAQADTCDLVVVAPTDSPDLYHAPAGDGLLEIEKRRELIRVKGAKPVAVDYDWTIWGPIVGHNAEGRPFALRWTLYDPNAIDFDLLGLEDAATVDEAIALAHRGGVPALNFLVADSSGRIAWTVAGRLPNRSGFDGRFPVSWEFGDRRWEGFLSPSAIPTISDPARPFLWSANNRLVGGKGLSLLGDGDYMPSARAAQIRDDLQGLLKREPTRIMPADLLSIALDDRALFLARWHRLLLETLSPRAVAAKRARAELRTAVESWDGRADVASAGYRLVRMFRREVANRTLIPIFAACLDIDPGFDWTRLHYEDAVWTLVHARPLHLLSPAYASWDELLTASADGVSAALGEGGISPIAATWGRRNTLRMQHPLARAFPGWLTRWLNMPAEELSGDTDMPRVQSPSFGASERFVVSPGHEAEGIFEMPGGQSGHPFSPFYRAGHEAWVRGEPAPFLPGPIAHRLVLEPAAGPAYNSPFSTLTSR